MKYVIRSPFSWLLGALLLLPLAALAPTPAAADDQGRAQAVPRGSSGSSGSSARSSAGSSRSSGSQGSVGRTRPSSADRPSSGRKAVTNRRGGSGSVHRHHRHGGHHRSFWTVHLGGYYGYPYFYGYPYHYGYPRIYWYNYRASEDLGAVDVNVRPKGAAVYLDGQRIGKVGEFDGFPGYLWLEEGTYDLVFYKEGHETLHEVVTIYPGLVIDLKKRMADGVATPAEEIVPPPHERPREAAGPADEDDDRPRRRVVVGTDAARLYFVVEPSDASIYLDGRFLGTAEELADLRSGLMVNPGAHELTVLHPSFQTEAVDLDVEAGEDLELEVHLKPGA